MSCQLKVPQYVIDGLEKALPNLRYDARELLRVTRAIEDEQVRVVTQDVKDFWDEMVLVLVPPDDIFARQAFIAVGLIPD